MKYNPKIVFFGTPEFVVPIVTNLYKNFSDSFTKSIVAVVTQPPSLVGRNKILTHSPVDEWAYRKKIPIILDAHAAPAADLGIVAAYGEIIPKKVIEKYKFGIINVHPSILPTWRGATPIQASIIANDQYGVSFIKMDEQVDHGPIISSFKYNYSGETASDLTQKLFERAALALTELIPNYLNGKINLREQEHKKSTYCRRLLKKDGFIEPKKLHAALEGKKTLDKFIIDFMDGYKMDVTPENLNRFITAMDLWPSAWTLLRLTASDGQAFEKSLKILKSHVENDKLILDEVQLEGKNPVSFEQFKIGYPEFKFE